MIQVFRVEHRETGVGPFQTCDDFTQKLAWRLQDFQHLRAPEHDGLSVCLMPCTFVFGCLCLTTLRQWFLLGETVQENVDIVEGLKSRDFVLNEYLVHAYDYRTSYSGTQVAFDALESARAGLVQEHDLALLLSPEVVLA